MTGPSRPARTPLTAVALVSAAVACAVLLLTTPWQPATASSPDPLPEPTVAEAFASEVPQLSSSQVGLARHVAAADPLVQRILSGTTVATSRVDAWSRLTDPGVIGAVIRIGLAKPVSFTEALPVIAYDTSEAKAPYYRTDLLRHRVEGATELVLSIDLSTRQVAGLRVDPDAQVAVLDPVPHVPYAGND